MEILDGIKIYFDFTLRDHLLYGEERDQFDRYMTMKSHVTSNCIDTHDKAMPSSIYGAIHLLRLFSEERINVIFVII
jgi:hypothetical protein